MAEQDRKVPVLDAVVAGGTLYPGYDCMVADPPGNECCGEENDMGEAFFQRILIRGVPFDL